MRRVIGLICVYFIFCCLTAFGQARAGGAIVAVDEASEAVGGGSSSPSKAAPKQSKTGARSTRSAGTTGRNSGSLTPITPARPYNGAVIGDTFSFLNDEVIDRVQPVYTIAAKRAGAKGLVQVAVLVETDGRVLQAKARTGNQLLWPEAERAALATRLNRPTDSRGRSVRALGFLVYRFGPPDLDD